MDEIRDLVKTCQDPQKSFLGQWIISNRKAIIGKKGHILGNSFFAFEQLVLELLTSIFECVTASTLLSVFRRYG